MRTLLAPLLGLFLAPAAIDTVPMTGYLERNADGSCAYAPRPGEPLAPVKKCPPTTIGKGGPPPAKLEPAPKKEGWLEKSMAEGSCWWSLHVPYECPPRAECKPNPTVTRVLCP
jgi:hypothetical protein